jgi:hypothetical protein
MTCPRCGNEWDVSKSPCSRCGLLVRLPGKLGARTSNSSVAPSQKTPPQPSQQSGDLPTVKSAGSSFSPSASNRVSPDASRAGMVPPPVTPGPRQMRDAMNTASPPPSSPSVFSSQRPKPTENNFSAGTGLDTPRVPGSFPDLGSGQNSLPGSSSAIGNGFSIPVSGGMGASSQIRRGPAQSNVGQPEARATRGAGIDSPIANTPRPSSAYPYAGRQVTDPLTGNDPLRPTLDNLRPPPSNPGSAMRNAVPPSGQAEMRTLLPGTLLRGGRYRLQEMQERQDWLSGVYEAWWIALDAMRNNAPVVICEVVTPDSNSMVMQSTWRAATMALTSIGRHPSIPTLWDAFGEQGRNFFVFEPVEGESLLARMRRTGRVVPEQDVVNCCLQMLDVIELLNQQSPPLVHGLIRPEHIVEKRNGQYVLTNFSVILAGGATQFISGLERSKLTPYMAPEMARGVLDMRSDLYSLLATAYYAVTGNVPSSTDGLVPPAQRFNPMVSPQFDAILNKGLRPGAGQRYQRPAELRQDLLSLRSVNGSVVPLSGTNVGTSAMSRSSGTAQSLQSSPGSTDSVAQLLPNMVSAGIELEEEHKFLLPAPEELPPMSASNDGLTASIWTVAILIALILVVFIGRH